jgi:hypothetical protein
MATNIAPTIIAPTNIPATDCIGNSLATINSNFSTLFADIQNLQQSIATIQSQSYVAKAWVCFDGTTKGNTLKIKSSYNVSSVTRNTSTAAADFGGAAGKYQINFTIPFSDTNYTTIVTSRDSPTKDNNGYWTWLNGGSNYKDQKYVRVDTYTSGSGWVNSLEVNVVIFSN